MKKPVLAAAAMVVAVVGFAQGTVQFNNSTAGALTKVYLPDGYNAYGIASSASAPKTGNTATDSIAGTQVYTGALLEGNTFTAQLWAANGSGQPESALVAGNSTTFRTGANAGRLAPITATLNNVPPDAAVASLQIRVFPTSYGSWANTLAALNAGDPLAWFGKSIVFDITQVGGQVNTPPAMTGLTSFSLGNPIPEPTTAALTVLGLIVLATRIGRKG